MREVDRIRYITIGDAFLAWDKVPHDREGDIIILLVLVSHECREVDSDLLEYICCRLLLTLHDGFDDTIHSEEDTILLRSVACLADTIRIEDDDVILLKGDLLFLEYLGRVTHHTKCDSTGFHLVDLIRFGFVDEEVLVSSTGIVHLLLELVPAEHDTGHHHILLDARLDDHIGCSEDIRTVFLVFRESRYQGIDHHHHESTWDTMTSYISDIDIEVVIFTRDDIERVPSYLSRGCTRHGDLKRWDDGLFLLEDMLLDFTCDFDFRSELATISEFLFKYFQDLQRFDEEAREVIHAFAP